MTRLLIFLTTLLFVAGCATTDGGQSLLIRTADPALAFAVHLAPPPPGVVVPAATPDPVLVELEEVEADQTNCVIAGNVGADNALIYHVPEGQYYSRVKIDLTRSNADGVFEQWFCSEEDALAAGFRKSSR